MQRPKSVFAAVLVSLAAACADEPAPKAAGENSQPAGKPAADAPAGATDETPEPEPPFAKVEGERGLRLREPDAFDGFTVISPLNSRDVHLVDMQGAIVHTWKTAYVPAGGYILLDNGHLLRGAMIEGNPRFHGGGIGGRIEELDWDGKVVWEYELANDQRTLHHDIDKLPNGNILAIAFEYHSPDEAFAKGRAASRVHEEGLWCDVVLEIRPTPPKGGEIVWEWRSFDHLVQDEREQAQGYGAPSDFPGRIDVNADHRFDAPETDEERRIREEREKAMQSLGYSGGAADTAAKAPDAGDGKAPPKKEDKYDADWLHTNAVEYLPEEDLIALSTPHMSEIWVIDHSTTTAQAATDKGGRRGRGGELLYRFGNPRNYGRGGDGERRLYYQHDPTWLPGAKPGERHMLVFNNGSRRPDKEFSEVLEFALPFDSASGFSGGKDQAFGPDEYVWTYQDPDKLFAPFISGAQRLPNGHTLICEGPRGRVLEVDAKGRVVWDFYNPYGGEVKPSEQGGKAPPKALFRAMRIAKDAPAVRGRL